MNVAESLKGTNHDAFIRNYLRKTTDEVVEMALRAIIKNNHSQIVAWATNYIGMENLSNQNRETLLALYILITQYPVEWNNMFEAAFQLLYNILNLVKEMEELDIYPTNWTQKIFCVERNLAPDKVKGIIFGIDPISSGVRSQKNYATGYAFAFNIPDDVVIDDSSSTNGLKNVYCLANINFNRYSTLETYFVKPYGIAMVNFIRTIPAYSLAGSGNIFREVWSAYHFSFLNLNAFQDRVLIFENEKFPFEGYASQEVQNLLQPAPRCSHPSYIQKENDHCLLQPRTKITNVTEKGDQSVATFVAFLNACGATEACRCVCTTCKANEARELELGILMMCLE